jgi:hypothetical protein
MNSLSGSPVHSLSVAKKGKFSPSFELEHLKYLLSLLLLYPEKLFSFSHFEGERVKFNQISFGRRLKEMKFLFAEQKEKDSFEWRVCMT